MSTPLKDNLSDLQNANKMEAACASLHTSVAIFKQMGVTMDTLALFATASLSLAKELRQCIVGMEGDEFERIISENFK